MPPAIACCTHELARVRGAIFSEHRLAIRAQNRSTLFGRRSHPEQTKSAVKDAAGNAQAKLLCTGVVPNYSSSSPIKPASRLPLPIRTPALS
jgi:hypothetical protein